MLPVLGGEVVEGERRLAIGHSKGINQTMGIRRHTDDMRAATPANRTNPAVRAKLVDQPLNVMGDGALLRQVLHNLLQNALDALHDSGRPQIILHTESKDTEILLCIEDNGAGFPQQVLSHAFEPYVTTKAKGTGLGLAIVKKMVEEHGGRIIIENSVNGGARINIYLPLVEVT